MRACHRVSRQHRSAGVAIVGKTYLSWSRRIFCSPGPQGVLFTSASRGPPQSIPLHPAGPGSVATMGIPSSAVPATFFFFFHRSAPSYPSVHCQPPPLPPHPRSAFFHTFQTPSYPSGHFPTIPACSDRADRPRFAPFFFHRSAPPYPFVHYQLPPLPPHPRPAAFHNFQTHWCPSGQFFNNSGSFRSRGSPAICPDLLVRAANTL